MIISILQQIDGARSAQGLTVVIDVFRAFSLECCLFARGAARILPVGAEQTARELKAAHPEYILIGERRGVKLSGFDYGNSPSQTVCVDLTGKTVIHTTSAGTQGLINASQADEILTGSLLNASAIARYIRSRDPETVSLVCMGEGGVYEAREDTLCAEYIRALLMDETYDIDAAIQDLRYWPSAVKFHVPENAEVFPEADYDICTQYDQFDFVLKAERRGEDIFESVRIDI